MIVQVHYMILYEIFFHLWNFPYFIFVVTHSGHIDDMSELQYK